MKVLIPIIIIFILIYLIYNYLHNKNSDMGGEIALSKKLWLFYTIWTWFIFLPFVLIFKLNSESYFLVWSGFTIFMWIRGFVEIYMLYISKNWIPPIGIAHDLFCLVWLIVLTPINSILIFNSDSFFHLSLILSVAAETYYAFAFYKIVGKNTKGDKPIWFANKENPEFKKVLKVTTIVNLIVFPILFIHTLNLFGSF